MSFMSPAERSTRIRHAIEEACIGAAWRQWTVLGAGMALTTEGRASSIIDPEALLLLSLAMESVERRLADMVAWWVEVGSKLLSVQRTKTLLQLCRVRASGHAGW